jgi:hypothetical protein
LRISIYPPNPFDSGVFTNYQDNCNRVEDKKFIASYITIEEFSTAIGPFQVAASSSALGVGAVIPIWHKEASESSIHVEISAMG